MGIEILYAKQIKKLYIDIIIQGMYIYNLMEIFLVRLISMMCICFEFGFLDMVSVGYGHLWRNTIMYDLKFNSIHFLWQEDDLIEIVWEL